MDHFCIKHPFTFPVPSIRCQDDEDDPDSTTADPDDQEDGEDGDGDDDDEDQDEDEDAGDDDEGDDDGDGDDDEDVDDDAEGDDDDVNFCWKCPDLESVDSSDAGAVAAERESCERLDYSEEVREARMQKAPEGYVCVKEVTGEN